MDRFEVQPDACRQRQARLQQIMQERGVDLAVVTLPEHVQYLAGPRFGPLFQPVAALTAEGHLTLVAPARRLPEIHAADEVLTYEAQWHSTLRNDQRAEAICVLEQSVSFRGVNRVGVEFSSSSRHLSWIGEFVDLEPDFYRLRRCKDSAELQLIRKAIDGTQRMYERAREIIEPGINELVVFNELQAAAVKEFGEPLTGTGNDYRCNARGGPPRDREAAAGELYILDLGPAFRGYFADNARTIAVTEPTDLQLEAHAYCMRVLQHVEANVRPGKSARELFQEAEEILRQAPVGEFNHHLGHGIGLFPHETPHLNPHWDDVFQKGDVFTAEPGLYAPELQAGIRIEDDFLVTDEGIERLTHFPHELML